MLRVLNIFPYKSTLQKICYEFLVSDVKKISFSWPYALFNFSNQNKHPNQSLSQSFFLENEASKAKSLEDDSEEEETEVLLEGDPLPTKPKYPKANECCGTGCRVCVYDAYEINLERYNKRLEQWKERQSMKLQSEVQSPMNNQEN